jgi:beta-glucosidase
MRTRRNAATSDALDSLLPGRPRRVRKPVIAVRTLATALAIVAAVVVAGVTVVPIPSLRAGKTEVPGDGPDSATNTPTVTEGSPTGTQARVIGDRDPTGSPDRTGTGASAHTPLARLPAETASAAGVAGHCPWLSNDLPVATRVNELMAAMTPLQEADMLNLYWGPKIGDPYEGVSQAIPQLCIPSISEQDGPAGVGSGWDRSSAAFTGGTQLPAPIADAAAFDPSLARSYGQVVGAEDAAVGIDMALAPTINILRDPLWGRSYESLGEDPYLTATLAVALIQGIQSNRVVAVTKHFAVYNQETGRGTLADDSIVSERALREIYLPAWSAAVQDGHTGAVMCAYNLINGVPACQDQALLQGILRGEWHFSGFVRSDCGSIFSQLPTMAAGVSQVKCTGFYNPSELAGAVASRTMSRSQLDVLVRPLLTVLFSFDLIAAPHLGPPNGQVSTLSDQAVGLQTANEGAVLMRNDGILPLSFDSLPSVALIGPDGGTPMSAGFGAMHVRSNQVVTALSALRGRLGGRLRYSSGASVSGAAALARSSTVAIVVVNDVESEGRDRTTLALSAQQDQLVQAVASANRRTVVVLETGGPVLMPWSGEVAAILETWYPGQDAGTSLVQLLSGAVDPSGKLPMTWPTSETARPDASPSQFGGVQGRTHYDDGIDVGYRWYEANGVQPAWAFGEGLTYTRFGFSSLQLQTRTSGVSVSLSVSNLGRTAGSDVVQVYVGDPQSSGEPPSQLRGFARVTLAPGATRRVQLQLTEGDLAHWDTTTGTWVVSAGTYQISCGDGSSLASLPLHGSVSLAGADLGVNSGPGL